MVSNKLGSDLLLAFAGRGFGSFGPGFSKNLQPPPPFAWRKDYNPLPQTGLQVLGSVNPHLKSSVGYQDDIISNNQIVMKSGESGGPPPEKLVF